MKKIIYSILLIFGSSLSAASPEGGRGGSIIISGNVGAYQTKDETGDVVNHDTQVTSTDGQLGFVFSSGIYIGGIYGNSISKIQGAATKPEMIHHGASLGYMTNGGLFLIGHYITEAEIKKATATADRTEGSGSQVDLGFVKNLVGPIFVGAQISSRNLEYKKLDTAGVLTESEHSVKELFPAIRISIIW